MNKIYYGLWQELYKLSWSLRLWIELLVILLIMISIFHILIQILRIVKAKRILVKIIVLLVTQVLSYMGKDNQWAYEADEKIVEWGNMRVERPIVMGHKMDRILAIGLCIIYLLAILPDTPIITYLDDSLVSKISMVKDSVQSWESKISTGYTDYAPIFTWNEEENEQEGKKSVKQEKKQEIYIQRRKANKRISLYKNPSSKSKVIAKIEAKDKIKYQDKYKKVGKKHWFKVYLPKQGMGGWIMEDVIRKKQLGELLGK